LDGTVEKGRDESEIGAHCQGKNKNSIGICYVGGLDINGKPKDTRTKEQKEALWNLLRELLVKYPKATIHGHRDFANKACPSFDVSKEYDIINLRDNIG
jgi:N-acetylmuramoyl-L-alanine amidase